MKDIDEKQLVIEDEAGNEHLMEILFTYEHEQRNKKYVFFYEPGSPEEVMVMSYDDEGNLEDVDDEEEYNEVQEVFNTFIEDPKINEEK